MIELRIFDFQNELTESFTFNRDMIYLNVSAGVVSIHGYTGERLHFFEFKEKSSSLSFQRVAMQSSYLKLYLNQKLQVTNYA